MNKAALDCSHDWIIYKGREVCRICGRSKEDIQHD